MIIPHTLYVVMHISLTLKYRLCIWYRFIRKPVSEINNKYWISVSDVKCGIGTVLLRGINLLVSITGTDCLENISNRNVFPLNTLIEQSPHNKIF